MHVRKRWKSCFVPPYNVEPCLIAELPIAARTRIPVCCRSECIIHIIVLTARSIKVTFWDHKGNNIKTIEGNEGDDLLSLAHEYDVDLEGKCHLQELFRCAVFKEGLLEGARG